MKSKLTPQKIGMFGMAAFPITAGPTWLDSEVVQSDYAQFRRRGIVRHALTNALIPIWADMPDTYFSTPAITKNEAGYISITECRPDYGDYLTFHPYKDKKPGELKKELRKAYKR